MAARSEQTVRRLGTTVSDNTVAASTTFTLVPKSEYRLATTGQGIFAKFGAGPVAAADADAIAVDPGSPLFFDSDTNTQISVIELAAGARVSVTLLKKQGD